MSTPTPTDTPVVSTPTPTVEETEPYSFFKNLGGLASDIVESSKLLVTEIENIPDSISEGYDKGLYIDVIQETADTANNVESTTVLATDKLALTDQEIEAEIAFLQSILADRQLESAS